MKTRPFTGRSPAGRCRSSPLPSAARRAGYGCLRYRPGDGSEGAPGYTVVSAGGEWPGTAEAPPGFRIPGAAGGLVLGVHRHDTDAESVVVYELAGAEGQPAAGGSIAQMAGADLTEATSATRAIAETDASAPDREPAGWRVETGVGGGNPIDTMRNAYSPLRGPARGACRRRGRLPKYDPVSMPQHAGEREEGNVAPARLAFREQPRPAGPAVPGSLITGPLELRTTRGEEAVVLQARAVPVRYRIFRGREDARDRGTGGSSDAEFARRLLHNPSTASGSLVIEPDWEEAGTVRLHLLAGRCSRRDSRGRPALRNEAGPHRPARVAGLPGEGAPAGCPPWPLAAQGPGPAGPARRAR